jgi:dTDP-4-dehydrorhamnose reductase
LKKIIITGSNGLLGQSLIALLSREKENYKIFGFSKGVNRSGRTDFDYSDVDITNEKEVKEKLFKISPDFIINTAAMTNVDACENDREACYDLNVNAVQYLTAICSEIKAHLIHLSTDFIFDGEKGNYSEDDVPNPLNYYGETKLLSEKILQNSTINYTILRTILVYGLVHDMSRSNIVLWVKESLENQKEITIVDDQFRAPTYVEDLAVSCKVSIDKKATGVFNISSSHLLSVYEIAQEIAAVFQLDKGLIKPISSSTLNQAAPRPPKTGFNLSKTNRVLDFYPKTFKEDLQRFKRALI